MSAASAMRSCLNLSSTPSKLFVKSGPRFSQLLRETPSCNAAASNTTQIFPSLCGWKTPWCGRYHILGVRATTSSSINFLVYPVVKRSSIKFWYLQHNCSSVHSRLFREQSLATTVILLFGNHRLSCFHSIPDLVVVIY